MPLLDHFHPPVSSLDAWVNFHGLWASTILMHLNGRVLPMPYKSQQQIHVGPNIVIDVATFEQQEEESLFSGYDPSGNGDGEGGVATPPQVYAPPAPPLTEEVTIAESDTFEVLIYRDENRWRLAAAIELVSPANKDRPSHPRTFADKCLGYLSKGVSVVVVDVVTNRSAQTHAEIVSRGNLPASFAWQPASGLSVVSYRTIQPKASVTRLDV